MDDAPRHKSMQGPLECSAVGWARRRDTWLAAGSGSRAAVTLPPAFFQLSSASRSGFLPAFQVSGRPAKGGVAWGFPPIKLQNCPLHCLRESRDNKRRARSSAVSAPGACIGSRSPDAVWKCLELNPSRPSSHRLALGGIQSSQLQPSASTDGGEPRRTGKDVPNETGAHAGWCHEQRCS